MGDPHHGLFNGYLPALNRRGTGLLLLLNRHFYVSPPRNNGREREWVKKGMKEEEPLQGKKLRKIKENVRGDFEGQTKDIGLITEGMDISRIPLSSGGYSDGPQSSFN
jgi:hypothetical protein